MNKTKEDKKKGKSCTTNVWANFCFFVSFCRPPLLLLNGFLFWLVLLPDYDILLNSFCYNLC